MPFAEAKWITDPACHDDVSPEFLGAFELEAPPERASLMICGLGFYEAFLNGERVSDALLQPAFSRYDKTCYYNAYEVAPLLKKGRNELQVGLGNGWYFETQADEWEYHHADWRNRPQLIAELSSDGKALLQSGGGWLCRESKTVFNSLRCGETMDASAGEAPWGPVALGREPGGRLLEQTIPPIRLAETLEGKPLGNGVWDFGLSLTGNAEIAVRGRKGDRVEILYGELLDENGHLSQENIDMYVEGGRFQRDEYILAGEGVEVWHSRFGYNGFRYAKVTASCEVLSVTGRCFYTDIAPAGGVETDDPLLSRLQSAILRSTLTNFHHIPTDCPHREKNGWTGDTHLSCEQALWNLEIAPAYEKFLKDVLDCARPSGQIPAIAPTSSWGYNWGSGPCWDLVLFQQPWQVYLFTGDKGILERHWEAQERYMAYLGRTSEGHVYRFGLGDWCPPREAPEVPTDMMNTAAWARMAAIMADAAEALGKTREAAEYRALFGRIRDAFREAFMGKVPEGITYWAQLLDFGLADDPEAALDRLIGCIEEGGYRMLCGIIGVKCLYKTLVEHDRVDVLMRMLRSEAYPGYAAMMDLGSGTLTERWDGINSRNHHMYSSIGEALYTGVAGIRLRKDAPGFRKVTIRPFDIGVPFTAWHRTPFGALRVSLDGRGGVRVAVPQGVEATLELPGRPAEGLPAGETLR